GCRLTGPSRAESSGPPARPPRCNPSVEQRGDIPPASGRRTRNGRPDRSWSAAAARTVLSSASSGVRSVTEIAARPPAARLCLRSFPGRRHGRSPSAPARRSDPPRSRGQLRATSPCSASVLLPPVRTLDSWSMQKDFAFEMAASAVRFGVGVTREVGMDLKEIGAALVLVVTDPTVAKLPRVRTVIDSLDRAGVRYVLYDRVRVEPTDESFHDAIAFAAAHPIDAIVAVGGGSTIDTAKAVNLYVTCPPSDFLDYVNPPIGRGLPVPGPLKPLMAIPTTAGTGSETTGVSIFDYKKLHAKTGIANRRLKPTLGYLDPENTRTMPSAVAASTGLDILS